MKKVDEEYSRTYDDSILYDLWYAHDYKGVLDYAATLPASDVRKGLMLAAIAVQQVSFSLCSVVEQDIFSAMSRTGC